MTGRSAIGVVLLTAAMVCAVGCAGPKIPPDALRLHESSLELRARQSRIFEAASEEAILAASVAVLQDMEYNLDFIEKPLGVLTASKKVDADSGSEKVGLFAMDMLCAIGGSSCGYYATASDEQIISLTLVVAPSLARPGDYAARVTIHYVVFDKMDRIKTRAVIDDAKVYEEIFAKLSKSLYLGAVE
jgi:hypothetical protein